RIDAGTRVAAKFEQGRNRFRLRAAQVNGIEVEREVIEQRRAQNRDSECSDDDRDAMRFQETVNRRQGAISDLVRFAFGIEQRYQGRQKRDAGGKSNQHSDASNLSKFGNTAVVGRQERHESRSHSRRSEGERNTDFFSGPRQRGAELRHIVSLRTVSHRELDAEIYAKTDE